MTVTHRVAMLSSTVQSLRARLMAMQEAMIGLHTGGAPVDPDHPMAAINPLEFRAAPEPSTSTVISFAGLATKNSMPPREFLRSLERHHSNILFCKDFWQCWYQRGLLGLTENVPDTLPVLQNCIPPGQTHLATIGTSAGGFAAILFGVMLGADKILALGPQTTIGPRVFRQFQNAQGTLGDMMQNGAEYSSLVQVLQANRSYKGRIQVHFSWQNAEDAAAAKRLERFPCVTLVGHDSPLHNVAKIMKEQGSFETALDWLMTPA